MSELLKNSDVLNPTNVVRFRAVMLKLMAAQGINATELARRINLPQPTVHRLIVGKTEDPKLSTLLSIADYFSITLDQLLGNVSVMNTENEGMRTMSIPVISWQEALRPREAVKDLTSANWQEWFMLDMKASPFTFGLKSKPSMEPRFSIGSILAVDPKEAPQDGNIVIVHYPETNEATIREIILDGPKKLLKSVMDDSEVDNLESGIMVIGTVIQTRYTYKKTE